MHVWCSLVGVTSSSVMELRISYGGIDYAAAFKTCSHNPGSHTSRPSVVSFDATPSHLLLRCVTSIQNYTLVYQVRFREFPAFRLYRIWQNDAPTNLKWEETKLQPSRSKLCHQLNCYLASLHFLSPNGVACTQPPLIVRDLLINLPSIQSTG